MIGIACTASDLNRCDLGLTVLAAAVRRGVAAAGGLPVAFPVMSLSEDLMKPTAMLYRNLLAIEVEETIRSQPLDGVVALGNCDKTVPAYLMALAVSVALSAVIIGAVLSTALLIGPAATALRVAKGPVRAMAVAAGIGVAAIWIGIVLAYDSFYWPPAGRGWPVSFFVVTLIVGGYLLTYLRRDRQAVAAAAAERPDAEQVCSPA